MTSVAIQVRVTRLAAGGDGLGRLEDGRVVFVEGGVPGDLVELVDLRIGKRMAKARIGRVVEASPDRTSPRCSHFGECGGCAWQHIRYEAQLEAKRSFVIDALERIGRIHLDADVEIVASPDPYNYRARARVLETPDGIGYRRRGSRQSVAVSECPILVPSAQLRLDALINERRATTDLEDGDRSARGRKARKAAEWEILAGSTAAAEAARVSPRAERPQTVAIEVLGESLVASTGSFVQGNALLWNALAEEVRKLCLWPTAKSMAESTAASSSAASSDGDARPRFVELYAGIGFLTLPLARAGARGVVFESDRAALRDLAQNLGRGGFTKDVEVVAGRIEDRSDWVARLAGLDFLLLDPPRVGLDPALRNIIAAAGPPRVVYVSCDPATLARDLRELTTAGYHIENLKALDLFPQTSHVEVVVRLERTPIPTDSRALD